MIEIKYKNWESITIAIFKKYKEIIKSNENDLDKNILILALFSNTNENEILNLKLNEINKLNSELSFLKEMPEINIKNEIKINNKDYYIDYNLKNITYSQFVDFQTYQNNVENNLSKILSVFILPKGKKYCEGYDIEEVINDIENHLSILYANSIATFFFSGISSFVKSYPNLFNQNTKENDEERENEERENKNSENNNKTKNFSEKFGWLYYADLVSQVSKLNFIQVYQLTIYEFFNLLSYKKDLDLENKKNIEKWKKEH